MSRPGQRDYSSVRLTRHALERFVERFGAGPEPDEAAASLRVVLSRTRRLGRNPDNGAIAVLAVYRARAIVAVLQDSACLTVLTWNQFLPRLSEFGRPKIPRKWGRLLRRLADPTENPEPEPEPNLNPNLSPGLSRSSGPIPPRQPRRIGSLRHSKRISTIRSMI